MTSPNEEMDKKFGDLLRLRESLKKNREIWESGWLTFAGLSDIWKKFKKLMGMLDSIPKNVSNALSALVLCNEVQFFKIAKELTDEEADDLIELLKEFSNVEDTPHPKLDRILTEFRDLINDFKTKPMTEAEMKKKLNLIKKSLMAVIPLLPKIVKVVGGKFLPLAGEKVKDKAVQVAIKAAAKAALVKLILAGLKAAGKTLPKGGGTYVGLVVTLLEFGFTMKILDNMRKLTDAINLAMSELICSAIDSGYKWPDEDFNFVWVSNPTNSKKVLVMAEAFVQCFKKDSNGKVTADEPCRASFKDQENGSGTKIILKKVFTKSDISQGDDRFDFKIDKDSANTCTSDEAFKCFAYVRVSVTWICPNKFSSKNILVGAKAN